MFDTDRSCICICCRKELCEGCTIYMGAHNAGGKLTLNCVALPKLLPVPWRTDALLGYGYASYKPTFNHHVDIASVVNLS